MSIRSKLLVSILIIGAIASLLLIAQSIVSPCLYRKATVKPADNGESYRYLGMSIMSSWPRLELLVERQHVSRATLTRLTPKDETRFARYVRSESILEGAPFSFSWAGLKWLSDDSGGRKTSALSIHMGYPLIVACLCMIGACHVVRRFRAQRGFEVQNEKDVT